MVAAMIVLGRFLRTTVLPGEVVGFIYTAVGWALMLASRLMWLEWKRTPDNESSFFQRVEVDISALQANFQSIQQTVGQQVRVMAVVKSDAYGHGLVECAQAIYRAGGRTFGVAEVWEGVAAAPGRFARGDSYTAGRFPGIVWGYYQA